MRILWDLDGTIFNSYPAILASFCTVYEEFHGNRVDEVEALRWLKRTSKEAFAHFGIPEQYRDRFKELDHARAETGSEPFSGVEIVLAAAEVNVIVTHRTRESTKELLEKWGLAKYFDEIVSPDDDGFPRKPEVDAYQYIHKKYQLDWAIGDRALDLIPAKKVGLRTCAFQNPNIEADLKIEEYTDAVVDLLRGPLK
ncbi:HAD hydrolase-like protein [Lederbergia galactosidilytica]|uniref:Haloacid dehalogenase n=1 Tax=Lederbergia galactosidilytica TaxID=217031 RepID=A0A177ZQ82_9BACI|nr:HAD hydrolase-like protein [Lederbergia galactosidilytica]KRG13183.1 haloacid dehalogenase [Virgibacillus soli]MBP1917287.1 phosphoglycolate phosphatase-like HAD superfamily hydrolase [Lederbergia galactosidilytica]OAK69008.1 haloacid dehalogenase [Lederbergia galactosidilytica]